MKKKILGIIIGGLALTMITGCGQNSTNGGENSSSINKTKGNCSAVECIKQINPENTVDDINKIIGFNGELTDEKYNKYYWELSEESGITVTYYSGSKGTIAVDIDRNILANSKVDFSRYNELQPKVKEGITYSEFISYIGNVEGTIIEKSSISTKYVWVAKDGSYLNGTFSNSSNKCTFASGMIK